MIEFEEVTYDWSTMNELVKQALSEFQEGKVSYSDDDILGESFTFELSEIDMIMPKEIIDNYKPEDKFICASGCLYPTDITSPYIGDDFINGTVTLINDHNSSPIAIIVATEDFEKVMTIKIF